MRLRVCRLALHGAAPALLQGAKQARDFLKHRRRLVELRFGQPVLHVAVQTGQVLRILRLNVVAQRALKLKNDLHRFVDSPPPVQNIARAQVGQSLLGGLNGRLIQDADQFHRRRGPHASEQVFVLTIHG